MHSGFRIAFASIVSSFLCYGGIGVERVDNWSDKIATGFDRPVWAGMPTGSKGKLWVIEQAGVVWIIDLETGKRTSKPFLNIAKDVSREGNEEGLLGLAFAPDFMKTGRFYVNFTDNEQHTRIVRFTSKDQSETDPSTAEVILRFKQDYRNHNGGWLTFGPDGMLYIGNGDGGSGNDPHNYAQALDTYLGKILRMDVSPLTGYKVPSDNPFLKTAGAKPEIWAYGVRNPWRCSFDRKTKDLWIGDVGQNTVEEVDYIPFEKAVGANYGWRLREGNIATPAKNVGGEPPTGVIEPIYTYKHGGGSTDGFSVTGGYVYRGPIKELEGRYIFADFQSSRIWSLVQRNGKAEDFKDLTDQLQPKNGRISLISSFAEDNDGNLFIVDMTGPVYKIIEK